VHPYGVDTPMGHDTTIFQLLTDHPNWAFSYSPGALPSDSLIDPDAISDIVIWLASDASSLVTAAQIPADKGYLKI
jgi:NAD(P)-dependent dehydrogenase (short-subunit alcohol dehydrogenase family)